MIDHGLDQKQRLGVGLLLCRPLHRRSVDLGCQERGDRFACLEPIYATRSPTASALHARGDADVALKQERAAP